MLARSVGDRIIADGPGVPFGGVADFLQGADIAIANLECAISDRGEPAPKGFTFRAPPAATDALAAGGIDVVSLANNHTFDYGPAAFADTEAALEARGIAHAGAGPNAAAARAPTVLNRNGLRIAFLSYVDVPIEWRGFDTRQWEATATTPGVAWLNVDQMQADVRAAREGSDLVVVLMHFGHENEYAPNDTQRAQARAAIDAGAALVIGHHPHVLQAAEWYGNGLIVYSLGNFVFDGTDNPTKESAVFLADLTEAGVVSYRFIPVTIDETGLPAPVPSGGGPASGPYLLHTSQAALLP
jgi:poly-gamma-glutamate synthesis protein (capsule biosynthesis protein)